MEREIRLEVHVVLRRMGRVRLKKASHFAFEKLVCTTNAKLEQCQIRTFSEFHTEAF